MMASSSRMLCSSSTTRTRVSATDRGEAEGEDAAGACRRLHVDLAAVVLHDSVDEGQPEPAAVGLRREERLEDVRKVLTRNALAGVADTHLETAARDSGRDPQLAPGGHRLDGIQ